MALWFFMHQKEAVYSRRVFFVTWIMFIIALPSVRSFTYKSLWVSTQDFSGILGLETQQKLLDYKRQIFKRVMDLTLVCIGGLLIFPIMICIALVVKLNSSGPILFRHKRIGMGGKVIRIWKFRTMLENADEVLQRCLKNDVDLCREWDEFHKLSCDPRITSVGYFLRKTSLDELPQLFNVLKGELSLIGPRPIVLEEVPKYKDKFEIYKKVKPGMTGLWQISGRNNTSYDERV